MKTSTVALVVLMTFFGCGGGGGSEAIQSQATASSKKSKTFPPAENILINGDFEGVVPGNELDVPPGWLANEALFFNLPPNWVSIRPDGNVSIRPNHANRDDHNGVNPQQGLYMAVLTTWGSAKSSLGQVLGKSRGRVGKTIARPGAQRKGGRKAPLLTRDWFG